MFPVLFAAGPITISSLGFFIALAFFFGGFGVWRKAKEEHFEDDDIFDVIFLTFFSGIIGSRLLYIFFNFSKFGYDFGKWINLAYSNRFLWLGFLIGLMYIFKIIAKRKKWDYFAFLDYSLTGIISAQILVRFGQFLDMSYIGKQTNFVLGIKFPGFNGARHPLALYEIGLLFFTYFLIKWLDKRYRLFKWYQSSRGEAQPGFLWLTYLLIISLDQFLLEFLNTRDIVFFYLSSYQIFLIFMTILVIVGFSSRVGNKLNSGSNKEEKLEVIRKPIEEEQPKTREKRFTRAKSRGVGFK